MKGFKTAIIGLCAILAASCSAPSARIEGTIAGAADQKVIVKLLDVNTYNVLDTIKTDNAGNFSYKVKVAEGQPEFVYLFSGDTKVSSLLLKAGDAVKVNADVNGNCTVEGSEESALLQEVERNFAAFLREADATGTTQDFYRSYVKYYRECLKYVMTHQGSLTVIPVLYQNINADFPVFSQNTDALHFRNAVDTLAKLYPDSRYVKALEAETVRREGILALDGQLSNAAELEYPNIVSKDINGKEVSLKEIDAKAILIHFWTVTDAASKIFNLDNLKPIYDEYHKKGFEILQVSLDTDKAAWASVVKSQNLPWINVNDGLGVASSVVTLYNIQTLPQTFLLIDGKLVDKRISGDKALRKLLDASL